MQDKAFIAPIDITHAISTKIRYKSPGSLVFLPNQTHKGSPPSAPVSKKIPAPTISHPSSPSFPIVSFVFLPNLFTHKGSPTAAPVSLKIPAPTISPPSYPSFPIVSFVFLPNPHSPPINHLPILNAPILVE